MVFKWRSNKGVNTHRFFTMFVGFSEMALTISKFWIGIGRVFIFYPNAAKHKVEM